MRKYRDPAARQGHGAHPRSRCSRSIGSEPQAHCETVGHRKRTAGFRGRCFGPYARVLGIENTSGAGSCGRAAASRNGHRSMGARIHSWNVGDHEPAIRFGLCILCVKSRIERRAEAGGNAHCDWRSHGRHSWRTCCNRNRSSGDACLGSGSADEELCRLAQCSFGFSARKRARHASNRPRAAVRRYRTHTSILQRHACSSCHITGRVGGRSHDGATRICGFDGSVYHRSVARAAGLESCAERGAFHCCAWHVRSARNSAAARTRLQRQRYV